MSILKLLSALSVLKPFTVVIWVNYIVRDALYTLGFFYEPRAHFFREELGHFMDFTTEISSILTNSKVLMPAPWVMVNSCLHHGFAMVLILIKMPQENSTLPEMELVVLQITSPSMVGNIKSLSRVQSKIAISPKQAKNFSGTPNRHPLQLKIGLKEASLYKLVSPLTSKKKRFYLN